MDLVGHDSHPVRYLGTLLGPQNNTHYTSITQRDVPELPVFTVAESNHSICLGGMYFVIGPSCAALQVRMYVCRRQVPTDDSRHDQYIGNYTGVTSPPWWSIFHEADSSGTRAQMVLRMKVTPACTPRVQHTIKQCRHLPASQCRLATYLS